MDVRNCKVCGNMFNYIDTSICPSCTKKLEEKFQVVKEFIRENPGTPISQVAEECEVPVQQLKRWVRQERLTFSSESGVTIDCEKCGKPILTGRFCRECKRNLTDTFSGMYTEKKVVAAPRKNDSKGKMRFLD
ncbi:MAG: transposase [Lachnospiraceae bacterium]|nr:transposase [Lachnospiraceae bacterium]